MFTGLIEQVGTLRQVQRNAGGASLGIQHEPWQAALELGESVAVMGACLTVTGISTGSFTCDVLLETLERTTLGTLRAGAALNLERALRMGDRLGGHMVSGHVDETGELLAIRRAGRDYVLRVSLSEALAKSLVIKGSVALDGVSLTISSLSDAWVEVCIIPHTWAHTALEGLKRGSAVNVEGDMLGKYVAAQLRGMLGGGGVSEDLLRSSGFLA